MTIVGRPSAVRAAHAAARCMAILVALLSATAANAEVPVATSSPSVSLRDAVAALERAGFGGVIAASAADGAIVEFALGDADREAHRRHRVDQRWLWASVTKQVTATLVMRQVDDGRLALDDTVAMRLPAFTGPTGARVTVRQLLQHTSGLPNPDDTPPSADDVPQFYRERGVAIGDTARALAYCAGTPLAEPGLGFAYDNCDYLVLGAILERVSGRSWSDLVATEIARPIGAASLAVAPDGAERGGSPVVGYQDATRRFPALNVATFGASGALVGTARDLLAFDRALIDRRLVSEAATAVMWAGDPKLGYEALGVWSFDARLRGCPAAVRIVERRGDVEGIQVRNVIAPALGRALVVFTNDASVDFGELWQGRGTTFDLASAAFCGESS